MLTLAGHPDMNRVTGIKFSGQAVDRYKDDELLVWLFHVNNISTGETFYFFQ